MRRVKFIMVFILVLLVLIVFNAIWFGVLIFTWLIKYLVIAGVLTWMFYIVKEK